MLISAFLEIVGVYKGKLGESYTAEKAAAQLVLDNVCPILYIFVVFYLT